MAFVAKNPISINQRKDLTTMVGALKQSRLFKFKESFAKAAPCQNSILSWHRRFLDTGSMLDRPRSGRPHTSDDEAKRIYQMFILGPTSST
ncbi:hypothetical protein AVEN_88990-1 [Araneus ventricosus]|uniref:DUF4817 domain-containing protein n=1 Tax=Araneus ventricosus TaxID=182803 RepID=A0A4Y2DLD1_ARAVE|nr:hypothetical protein AVEN_88990-1 [Araneus ventricosus]